MAIGGGVGGGIGAALLVVAAILWNRRRRAKSKYQASMLPGAKAEDSESGKPELLGSGPAVVYTGGKPELDAAKEIEVKAFGPPAEDDVAELDAIAIAELEATRREQHSHGEQLFSPILPANPTGLSIHQSPPAFQPSAENGPMPSADTLYPTLTATAPFPEAQNGHTENAYFEYEERRLTERRALLVERERIAAEERELALDRQRLGDEEDALRAKRGRRY